MIEADLAHSAPGKRRPDDDDPGFAVYVHWPFCLSKCPYCDFNSHVRGAGVDEARYLAAFRTEIAHRAALVPGRAVRSAGHRAALAQFVLRGLDRTRSGVLVYVSLAEHYIRIVPAEAAAAAIPPEAWQRAVDRALPQLAAGAVEAALKGLAEDCAVLLSAPFPPHGTPDTPERHRFHVVG